MPTFIFLVAGSIAATSANKRSDSWSVMASAGSVVFAMAVPGPRTGTGTRAGTEAWPGTGTGACPRGGTGAMGWHRGWHKGHGLLLVGWNGWADGLMQCVDIGTTIWQALALAWQDGLALAGTWCQQFRKWHVWILEHVHNRQANIACLRPQNVLALSHECPVIMAT